ncbi:MAG: archease [Thermodesulfobacteriota bacterium]|nr:archease [Thermodesulfobacteriota bacterium]
MQTGKPDFSLFDHTADLGIVVRGTDLKNLFQGGAKSMMQIMVIGKSHVKTRSVRLTVTGDGLSDLMVRWLGEVLYLLAGEKQVVTDVVIESISPSRLDATLKTVPFDPNLHEIVCEIKAVTYHQIQVAERGDRWEARIVFDL